VVYLAIDAQRTNSCLAKSLISDSL